MRVIRVGVGNIEDASSELSPDTLIFLAIRDVQRRKPRTLRELERATGLSKDNIRKNTKLLADADVIRETPEGWVLTDHMYESYETETIEIPKMRFRKVLSKQTPSVYMMADWKELYSRAVLVLANMMHRLSADIAEIDEVNLDEGYIKIMLKTKRPRRKKKPEAEE